MRISLKTTAFQSLDPGSLVSDVCAPDLELQFSSIKQCFWLPFFFIVVNNIEGNSSTRYCRWVIMQIATIPNVTLLFKITDNYEQYEQQIVLINISGEASPMV